MEVDPGQRASSIRRKRPSLPSARKGMTEQPRVVVGILPGVGGILAPPEGGQDARAREPSLARVDEQPRVRARRPRLGLPRPAQLSGMLSGSLLHVPRHEGPAARGSTCIVSHRCSREHVHRQSPLPEGACALSVTAAHRGVCAPLPSVTAAQESVCIVSHRCPREHVHRRSPLLEGACAASLCQSPLLEGACALLVAAAQSGTCISSSVTAARGSMCIVTAASPPLEGTRAVTAARGSTCSHRCSRSVRVNRGGVACASSCESVAAVPTVGRTRLPITAACERVCTAGDFGATSAGVGIGGHRCSWVAEHLHGCPVAARKVVNTRRASTMRRPTPRSRRSCGPSATWMTPPLTTPSCRPIGEAVVGSMDSASPMGD